MVNTKICYKTYSHSATYAFYTEWTFINSQNSTWSYQENNFLRSVFKIQLITFNASLSSFILQISDTTLSRGPGVGQLHSVHTQCNTHQTLVEHDVIHPQFSFFLHYLSYFNAKPSAHLLDYCSRYTKI